MFFTYTLLIFVYLLLIFVLSLLLRGQVYVYYVSIIIHRLWKNALVILTKKIPDSELQVSVTDYSGYLDT